MMKKLFFFFLLTSSVIYSQNISFTGATGGNWNTASNWSGNAIPTSSDNVDLGTKTVNITSTAVCNNLTIGTFDLFGGSGQLVISDSGSLHISGNVDINQGFITMNSSSDNYSTLIVDGSSTGNIIYYRSVNDVNNGWDLVGPMVTNWSNSSFVSNNNNLATNPEDTSIYAFSIFDNTLNPYSVNSLWVNYDDDVHVHEINNGNLTAGKGYRMATSNSGDELVFFGILQTNTVNIDITNRNNYNGSRWNLVSNPYTSYVNSNSAAGTNNFLSDNLSKLDSNFQAIYGWNGSSYFTIDNLPGSTAKSLAPGQGFFLAPKSNSPISSETITFNTNTRTVSGANSSDDDFISGRLAQDTYNDFFLKLYEEGITVSENRFFFDNNLTLGLDPGFDIGAFDQNMDIVSRLVENDQGIGFSINAMGLNSLNEETVIPLVLNRDAGVEFSISFEDSSIPEDVGVYLEDTLLETLTDLRSSDFTLTPESDLSDMGRFYLRIGNTSLGGNDLDESYISIYKAASDDFVTIEGLSNVEKANVQLFNIIGQEVLSTTLSSNQSTQRIYTSGLTTGVYVIRLQADSSLISKKIIIN